MASSFLEQFNTRGRSMSKIILSSVFLLLLSVSLAAQTEGWKQYSSTVGNFKVLFPGEPDVSVNDNGGDKNLYSQNFFSRQGEVSYTIVYAHMDTTQTVND